ncbi:hypothetical protein NA56DRAFT_683573 [Hyaloscypha hepaticicola]|uniref:Uncharacterized protein n=1 Tax=Hyaloscypha hepaticicola TaxID=2082293 RepID=A0A2J6QPB4_9HELO|nr:hypothetical protein NA56DRAFT_683573 [Hyaloscypha hepaticicola]
MKRVNSAFTRSFTEVILFRYQNRFLTRINNEARVRYSTKSIVLGKGEGKVMNFEDIEEARAKHIAKEVIKGKGKRGRKCKSTILEANELEADKSVSEVVEAVESEPEPEVARAAKEDIKARGKRGRKCRSVT